MPVTPPLLAVAAPAAAFRADGGRAAADALPGAPRPPVARPALSAGIGGGGGGGDTDPEFDARIAGRSDAAVRKGD